MTQTVYSSDVLSGPDGSFSASVYSLASGTTYYYKAFMTVWNGSRYVDVESYVGSFTTPSKTATVMPKWLELPASTNGGSIIEGHFGAGSKRNYTYHYDTSVYTALWTAYPLTATHISGSASSSTWYYNPDVGEASQINVKSNSYGKNYGGGTYSRGHQIPAADRKCDATMLKQTYYLTNQTPQIQNNFNSPMWSNLEQAVRNLTTSTDTVYVVTGAAFRKVGGSEEIAYLTSTSSSITPAKVPVPNYYWKVLLKVKRSGTTITNASAIGFWMEHVPYSDSNAWQSAAVSVSVIESYTGFDFFTNLPGNLKSAAKANTSWSTFQSF